MTFDRQVPNRVVDFWTQTPDALDMVTLAFSPRGTPASYRTVQGFGVNAYKRVDDAGETRLVKDHWLPKQGVRSWTAVDAQAAQGQELGVRTRDLYDAIERGDHPSWELHVQLMSDDEHPELDVDPLDDTTVWPENDFPTRKRITRTDDNIQAGQRYVLSEPWERDELVADLVDGLSPCDRPIQERMLWHPPVHGRGGATSWPDWRPRGALSGHGSQRTGGSPINGWWGCPARATARA